MSERYLHPLPLPFLHPLFLPLFLSFPFAVLVFGPDLSLDFDFGEFGK